MPFYGPYLKAGSDMLMIMVHCLLDTERFEPRTASCELVTPREPKKQITCEIWQRFKLLVLPKHCIREIEIGREYPYITKSSPHSYASNARIITLTHLASGCQTIVDLSLTRTYYLESTHLFELYETLTYLQCIFYGTRV